MVAVSFTPANSTYSVRAGYPGADANETEIDLSAIECQKFGGRW